eukprot:3991371-Pyramimonas_sp.AAC.1
MSMRIVFPHRRSQPHRRRWPPWSGAAQDPPSTSGGAVDSSAGRICGRGHDGAGWVSVSRIYFLEGDRLSDQRTHP